MGFMFLSAVSNSTTFVAPLNVKAATKLVTNNDGVDASRRRPNPGEAIVSSANNRDGATPSNSLSLVSLLHKHL